MREGEMPSSAVMLCDPISRKIISFFSIQEFGVDENNFGVGDHPDNGNVLIYEFDEVKREAFSLEYPAWLGVLIENGEVDVEDVWVGIPGTSYDA